jgi:PAS domain S-box-containing protein
MESMSFRKEEIIKIAQFQGMGFYISTREGQFLECDERARKIFGIPIDETDLSKYSIVDYYVAPSEREGRLKEVDRNKGLPVKDVLPARINGQYKYLFDICWCCDELGDGQKCYIGIVTEIESYTLSPQIFDTFPVGLYEVDESDKIVHANQELVRMLYYQTENQLLGKHFGEIWEHPEELEEFNRNIFKNGYAAKVITIRGANNNKIKVECYSQTTNGQERYGMINKVTQKKWPYHAMEKMPTGYFHIRDEKIVHCNDHFAKLMGFENKQKALGGKDTKYFKNPEDVGRYIQALKEHDNRGEPLQNYEIEIRKQDSNQIVTMAIDSHLIKDERGNVIGREGTIRDISEMVELREQVKEAQLNLEKTTADINNLIHTFLHPVVKFSGNSQLHYKLAKLLHQIGQPKITAAVTEKIETEELAGKLSKRIIDVINDIPDTDETIPFIASNEKISPSAIYLVTIKELKQRLRKICYMFDHSLSTSESNVLLEDAIRNTAFRLLNELKDLDFTNHELLRLAISNEFIEFLQDILFNYLVHGATMMVSETEIMKQKVEAIRGFIGLKMQRTYSFVKYDISKILEENINRFKPVFLDKKIEIHYEKMNGDFYAKISPNDIDRVTCNLLDNARKYSFDGPGRFVKVKIRELGHINSLEISIESLGIPIKKKELEQIWKFGYRGSRAFRSARHGTGVGLADSWDVIEAHKGKIEITSTAARDDGEPPQYQVPYLTKVTITLPKTRKDR